MESQLYKEAPAFWRYPIVVASIGGKRFTDDDIYSVSISYGNSSVNPSIEVPSAVIKVVGKLPMLYGARVTIDAEATPYKSRRFFGIVGKQVIENDAGEYITSLTCVAHSIRVLRSEREKVFTGVNGSAHLLDAVNFVISEGRRIGSLPLGLEARPGLLENMRFRDNKKPYKVKEIVELLIKNAVSVFHQRDGSLQMVHAAVAMQLVTEAAKARPVLLDEVLSPATYEQEKSLIDRGVTCEFYTSDAPDQLKRETWTDTYLPKGVPWPLGNDILDLTDFSYSADTWKYAMRAATLRALQLRFSIPEITFDIPMLARGKEYDHHVLRTVLNLNEGGIIGLGADWDSEINGLMAVKGISEEITPSSWRIKLSLVDPVVLYGLPTWNWPLPKPLAFTWGQLPTEVTWQNITSTWEGMENGYRK